MQQAADTATTSAAADPWPARQEALHEALADVLARVRAGRHRANLKLPLLRGCARIGFEESGRLLVDFHGTSLGVGPLGARPLTLNELDGRALAYALLAAADVVEEADEAAAAIAATPA